MQIGSTVLGAQTHQARATRAAGGRVAGISPAPTVDAVAQRDDTREFRAPPAPRRSQPAGMLYAMFEQMGGAATSVWKGMHVNTVI